MTDLNKIFEKFKVSGPAKSIIPYGSGHIHDTFKAETIEENNDDYILQKLNNHVFKNIEQLQENITLVCSHIRSKLIDDKSLDLNRNVLTVIYCHDGNPFYIDDEGSYWRMYIFISKHRTYDIVENKQHAFEGGRAIGKFQALLADLESSRLHYTIPYFHDIEKRIETFNEIVSINKYNRNGKAIKEIDFVKSRSDEMGIILKLGKEGKIPLRTTHNDTKFNNILLDDNDMALCVIDLDTVMPGYVHYDFGDAIRTSASRSSEDEKDLSRVELDIELFKAYSEGYISEIGHILTKTEIEYLAFAPRLITFTIGLRFLTDYLNGDNYFKINHPEHNLQRSRTQFKLVESNEEKYKIMQTIIAELADKHINSRL